MIERRRERQTLDALHDLVRYLRGVREERKAILTITDGWRLFRPNTALARQLNCQVPTGPQVTIDPRTGRPTTKPTPNTPGRGLTNTDADPQICERDRMMLAHARRRAVLSATCCTRPIARTRRSIRSIRAGWSCSTSRSRSRLQEGSEPMTPLTVDASRLRARLDSLRTLAENTDGLAIVDSNNLAAGMKRVVADLSSYYLLGYYSNAKLDGKFHAITVRVKRPGVQVRARTRVPRGDAGRDDRRCDEAAVRPRQNLAIPASKRRSRPTRKPPPSARRSVRSLATRAKCRCGCRWPSAGSPATRRPPRCGWWASSAAWPTLVPSGTKGSTRPPR